MVRWLYCDEYGFRCNVWLIRLKMFAVDIGNILVYEQKQTGVFLTL